MTPQYRGARPFAECRGSALAALLIATSWAIPVSALAQDSGENSSPQFVVAFQLGIGSVISRRTFQTAGEASIQFTAFSGATGLFGRVAMVGLPQECKSSLPPLCAFPSGGATGGLLGVERLVTISSQLQGTIELGGGMFIWHGSGSDPALTAGMGALINLNQRMRLEVGARWNTIWTPSAVSFLLGQIGTRIALGANR